MIRFQLLGLLAPLSLVACIHTDPVIDGSRHGDGLASDLAPGEATVVDLYELEQGGYDTEIRSCAEAGDGLVSSDPTIVRVTPFATEVINVNSYEAAAFGYVLTGIKPGTAYVTAQCNGDTTSIAIIVR